MINDICHIRPTAFFLPLSQQAALEHMESIIYDPHQLLSNVEVQVAEEGAFEDASEKLSTEQCISTEIKGAEDKKVDQA